MRTNRDDIRRMTRSSAGATGGGTGGGSGYALPLAADGTRGGVQIGYTTSAANKKYAVQLDSEKMYVEVGSYPWAGLSDKPKTATRWPSWSEVTSKPVSKTAWGQTYLDSSSEFQNISGDLSAGSSGGTISQFHSIELNSAGSLGGYGGFIDFHFNGSQADYTSRIIEDASGEINIQATTKVSNLYSRGYVTALSDARKKRVLGDIVLSAEQIAKMPAVRFEWKNNENPGIFIGTLAQNWREILPEAVHTLGDSTLSFDYQSAALVSVINLAREIEAIKSKLNRYGFK